MQSSVIQFAAELAYLIFGMWYMNELIKNINKLHTTELGAERIKRNLTLGIDDVVTWCKKCLNKADFMTQVGKNWYVYWEGKVITINAFSYTIITAHKISPKIRVMVNSDYLCLEEFLYQAIFVPEGMESPPRSIIEEPEIFVYIHDFGLKAGDLGVVAEQNGQIIGAAWTRIISAFGHIDENTPELAISLLPGFRNYGIGTKLMNKIFQLLRINGYKQTSLSVQKDNPAVKFYQDLGYEVVDEKYDHVGNNDYLMIKRL